MISRYLYIINMKWIILTVATAFLCVLVSGQDPEIAENILPVVKRIGVQAQLSCHVINQQNNPVFWTLKAFQTVLTENDKIVIDSIHNIVVNGYPKYMIRKTYEGQRTVYTLIVSRLEPRDSGFYTCSIHIRGSQATSPHKDGEIVVMVPPSIMQAGTTNTVSVKVGEALNLTCTASGYPTPNITWIRVNGKPLPVGTISYVGGALPIKAIKKEDRGIFRCLADNSVRPPYRHDITVNVFFSPVAHAVQSSYGQAANRRFDVTVECRIAGFPEAELQWFKVVAGGNWAPISETDKFKVNILLNHVNNLGANERWFQLVILSVQANDFGDYICQGINSYGRGHATVKLFETSECQGPNCEYLPSIPGSSSPEMRSASLLLVTMLLLRLL